MLHRELTGWLARGTHLALHLEYTGTEALAAGPNRGNCHHILSPVPAENTLVKKFALLLALVVLSLMAARPASAENLILADQNAQPGVVLSSNDRHELNEIHRRGPRVATDHPGAVAKIQSVAVTKDGTVFFASGLDGFIFQLSGGRETLVHTHRGQVRHLALGASGETLFFSVLATPTDGAAIEDGQIFELDLRTGTAGLFTNVRQSEVERGWWGAFAMQGDKLYLGTIGKPSRIYEVVDDVPSNLFETYDLPILGLAVTSHGDLLFTGGTDKVFAVRGGRDPAVVLQSIGRRLCDVSLPPKPRRESVAKPVLDLPIEPPALPTDDDVGRIIGKLRADAEDRWGSALVYGPDDRERLQAIQKISANGDFRFDGLRAGRYWVLLSRADLDLSHVLRPAVIEVDVSGGSQGVEFRLETK